MVVDRSKLKAELSAFYNFRGKSVLYVGAGGGQLLDPGTGVSRVVAIDSNASSLDGFRSEEKSKWGGVSLEFVPQPFEKVDKTADLVYFEFCLHEMADPASTLRHAVSLAPEAVVMDHLPGSPWIFFGAEEEAVQRSAYALESFGVRRRETLKAMQLFDDFAQLEARMADAGEAALNRISSLKGTKGIKIQMDYGIFLLQRGG